MEFTVTVGTCRVKMKWDKAEGGWERLEDLNTEVTAAAMLSHDEYKHCVTPAISSSVTTPSPS